MVRKERQQSELGKELEGKMLEGRKLKGEMNHKKTPKAAGSVKSAPSTQNSATSASKKAEKSRETRKKHDSVQQLEGGSPLAKKQQPNGRVESMETAEIVSDAGNTRSAPSKTSKQAGHAKSAALSKYSLVKKSGGKLSNCPPVFTRDSRYFLCCSGTHIKVYSVATGHPIRTITSSSSAGGHMDTITAIMLNPHNHMQLYTASLDGTICLWDFNDGALLKSWSFGVPILHMKVSPADSRMVYVVYKTQATVSASAANAQNTPKKKKNRRVVARFNLKNTAKQTLFILRDCVALDVSEDGQYLVAATRTKMHVWTLATNEEVIHTLSYDITSLTIHPNGNCIAVGDRVGRITLWYCLNGPQDTKPVITTMHWHAHQVNDLAFTNDGEYLLSGGEEAVLVIWQLQTRSKQFLPRLGADILSIAVSPDQMYYAVGQSDNTVRIVSSVNLTITQAVVGLKCAQLNRKIYPLSTGIVVEPRNNYVVMNGAPGSLQFFNPYTDRHVLELEVTPGNRVSRTEEKEIIRPHVTQLAFSPSGDWMITVDVRDSGETEPEVYLKFWAYNADSQTYWVNTRVDNPHGAKITSLRCGPMTATGALMAVTTSVQDRKFKVWQLTEHAEGEFHWSCRSVGYYKDLPAYDAAFSEDGSILAVSFGQVITLWDPTTNGLQMVMTCPPPVRNAVGFGNTESAVTDGTFQLTFCNGGSPYLVSSTDKYLHVWNLLTCSVWWSYRLNVKRIMADPSSANFLVWADLDNETSTQTPSNESPKRKVPLKHQQILVFHPSSPTPVAVQEVDRRCQAVTFGRKSSASASSTKEALADVLLVTNQFELQRLSDESKVAGDNGDDVKDTNEPASEFLDDKPKSFLSSLYGDSAISQVQPATATSSESQPTPTPVPSVGKSSFKFIDIPTFMLPVPSKLAVPFFESILAKASPSQSELQSTTESSTEEKQESTSMMDIDTPPQTDTTASANKATELEDFEDGAMDFMADFFKTRMG